MNKRIIITAALFGLMAVVLGAFGAHALKDRLSVSDLDVWKTAVNYQFYHVLALLFLSTFSRIRSKLINLAYWFFTGGIVLFSGSLYLLSSRSISHLNNISFLGPVTPVGGLLFILGWLALILAAVKYK